MHCRPVRQDRRLDVTLLGMDRFGRARLQTAQQPARLEDPSTPPHPLCVRALAPVRGPVLDAASAPGFRSSVWQRESLSRGRETHL
eukprot:366051-Chlamydomonas_euryale.AAC.6